MDYNGWSLTMSCLECPFFCRTEPEFQQHRALTGHNGTYGTARGFKSYNTNAEIKREASSTFRSRQPLHTPDGRLVGWKNISLGTEEQFNESGNSEWSAQMSQGYNGSSYTAPSGGLVIQDDKGRREMSRGQKRKLTTIRSGCPSCGCSSEGQCSKDQNLFSPYWKGDSSQANRLTHAEEHLRTLSPLDDLLSTETLEEEETEEHSPERSSLAMNSPE